MIYRLSERILEHQSINSRRFLSTNNITRYEFYDLTLNSQIIFTVDIKTDVTMPPGKNVKMLLLDPPHSQGLC